MIRRGTRDDFETVVALSNGQRLDVEWRWSLPSFDPHRHLWLADGAYGALYAPDIALVRGDAERIGGLLAAIEEQAREEGHAHLTCVIPAWDERAWRAYEASGFELATEVLQMEIAFDDPPPDTRRDEIRTYTDDDAQRVKALLDEAYGWDDTYEPLSHADWLAYMTQHESFDPECWFVAEEMGTLLGVCLCWKEGWIKDLAVGEGARGRGLGEALLRHAFARLYDRGVRRVGLKVDAGNPTSAIRLYERVGMRTIKTFRMYVKHL